MPCAAAAPHTAVLAAPRRAACRTSARRAPGAVRVRATAASPEDDVASAEVSRRGALSLAAAAAAAAVAGAGAAPAEAAFGLRKIGRSAKFDDIKMSDYKTLPSGLKYYDVVVGSGAIAKRGKRVAVHYDCKWKTLTVSTSRVGMGVTGGVPYGFDLGTKAGTPGGPFIEGMNLGVEGMLVGGQRKIIVPPELAYGKLQVQEIPPNATLTFDIELLSIKKDNVFGKEIS